MKKHPGIWFSLWTIETLFLLSLEFGLLDLTEFQFRLSQLFLRIWLYLCAWWITVFHVRWLTKLDEKLYKKQKEKDNGSI
jgi:hypothetical protein